MARFRLRFLLQEFDLKGPEVMLGRSPDCQITLEDPLVSRRHALIRIEGDQAIISDLGSRNGVRVNGERIEKETVLADGDRVRIGTQELVFSLVAQEHRPARPTGYLRVCAVCGTPYPEQAPQCPHCGGTAVRDDETASAVLVDPRRSWTFGLFGEILEKTLRAGRSTEAERLLRRAKRELDELHEAGGRLETDHIEMIATFAINLGQQMSELSWVSWALDLHRKQDLLPSAKVVDALEGVDVPSSRELSEVLTEFIEWCRRHASRAHTEENKANISRLERVVRGPSAFPKST